MSKTEKSDFKTRQRVKFLGGQVEAFDDWGVANSLNRLDIGTNNGNREGRDGKNHGSDNLENGKEDKSIKPEKATTDKDEFQVVGKKKWGRKFVKNSYLSRSVD